MEGNIRMGVAFHTEFGTKVTDVNFHGFSEWIRVRIEMEGHRVAFLNELAEDFHRFSPPDNQSSLKCLKISRERFEALAEEMLPIRACPSVRLLPLAYYI